MVGLYNDETAFERHIAPLDPHRFVELVQSKSYFDPEGLFVATEGAEVVGWVHACVAPGSESWHDPREKVARIRMLIFPRNSLSVGRALVYTATQWLRKREPDTILAMHTQKGYPFYRGLWLGCEPMCPSTLPHVHMALDSGGYRHSQESAFLVAEMSAHPRIFGGHTDVEYVERVAKMSHEPMRESWIGFHPVGTVALIDGETVGRCAWVLLPHLDRLGAPCMNIWGLGVDARHRRKGIATAIISRAMCLAYAHGARFASASTQLWNTPAHATYAKLGFRPHCIVAGRALAPAGESP
jgi:GNAT superfamily N-acetyltransferase